MNAEDSRMLKVGDRLRCGSDCCDEFMLGEVSEVHHSFLTIKWDEGGYAAMFFDSKDPERVVFRDNASKVDEADACDFGKDDFDPEYERDDEPRDIDGQLERRMDAMDRWHQ